MLDTPPLGEPTEFGQAMMEAKLEAACQKVGLSQEDTHKVVADFRAMGYGAIVGAFEIVDGVEQHLNEMIVAKAEGVSGETYRQKREELGLVCYIGMVGMTHRMIRRIAQRTSLGMLGEPCPN